MSQIKISPSILSADFANLQRDMQKLKDSGADMAHIDVMDGHFVPNISIGVPVVKSLRKVSDLFFDVHLMISDPLFCFASTTRSLSERPLKIRFLAGK